MTQQQVDALQSQHEQRFGTAGEVFAAPARVNLIGEHTDYTGGFVLPMAIDFETVAVVSPLSEPVARILSANFDGEMVEEPLPPVKNHHPGEWSSYPLGVAWSLGLEDVHVPGFSLTLGGDVPLGAGLSSSASVEVATAMALLHLAAHELPGEVIATLCRRAENDFVGASCGIMDQFVITNAQAQRALLLDCRSLEYELLPLPERTKIIVVNSMVQHSNATGEYGDRRGEVERGQAALRAVKPGIQLLRDATLPDLEAARGSMDQAAFLRCRHIITENARVQQMKLALAAGDRKRIGELLHAAHISFRDDFAASCPEVDALVEIAAATPGCIGARITGGGFGGCTVNLVEEDAAQSFVEAVCSAYRQRYAIDADAFICEAVDGAVARTKKLKEQG